MSRYSLNRSYGHRIKKVCPDEYKLSWTVDRYYSDSRLRFPRKCCRFIDERGARRFAKKWGIDFPEDKS